ncbi:MAG: hypothetical protein IJT06_01495 [Selenomonadaceae bacterium]|nr:hypothetical protein [Selenomonadaceae bacterium]
MEKLSTLIVAACFGLLVLYKFSMLILTHWFVSALIVGVATFFYAGKRLAAPATILSLIILFVLNVIFVEDSKKSEYQSEEHYQQEESFDKERLEREWQELERQSRERQERERQEREEQERFEREQQERQERLERQERQERQERERQEQASASVYNKIFNDYYGAISAHRFSDAYSLLSEREKQHQGSLESFAKGRQDVADIEILNFKVTDERESTVNADYRIKTKDNDGNGFLVRTFDGNVTFTKSAGTWKIDALSSRKIDEHRE